MLKKLIIISLSCFCLTNISFATLPVSQFSSYIFFGDSLTDVGNFQTVENTCTTLPAPITNHTGGTYYDTVWANTGVGPFNSTNVTASKDGGNDYAWASAQTVTPPTPDPDVHHLDEQLADYLSHHTPNPNTLYTIWIGSNDLISILSSGDDPQIVIKNGTGRIVAAILELYQRGAKNFLIIGLPNVAETPFASNPFEDTELRIGTIHDQASLAQEGAAAWNQALTTLIFSLRLPGIKIWYFDVATLLSNVVAHPTNYGFPPQIEFYSSGGLFSDGIPLNSYPNNEITSCGNDASGADTDPDHYIFFNFIHPTAYTHHLLAQHVLTDAQCATPATCAIS